MKVTINNKVVEVKQNTSIIDLIEDDKYQYQAARVNNRIRELNYLIQDDCYIELMTLKDKKP